MKHKTLDKPPGQRGEEVARKAPYSSPVLRVFGSVKQLTKANNGSWTDGNASNPGNFGKTL